MGSQLVSSWDIAGFQLLLTLLQLVWTGQVKCMSRGSATESPAGHLASRCAPNTSAPFAQEMGPQVLGSLDLHPKGEGAELERELQAKVSTFCSCGSRSRRGCRGSLLHTEQRQGQSCAGRCEEGWSGSLLPSQQEGALGQRWS